MTDAVNTTIVYEDFTNLVVNLTNLSDGTGESAVHKIIIANHTAGASANLTTSFTVDCIEGDSAGMEVQIYADHSSPVVIARLGGLGKYCRDYRSVGGLQTSGSGGTGDICVTTNGASSGDSYDITLHIRKAN